MTDLQIYAVLAWSLQDFTYGAEECSFSLEVPHNVTPGFRAASCGLDWHLHFEFVIAARNEDDIDGATGSGGGGGDPANDADGVVEWNAPRSLDVQTLEWDLPMTVLPADPALLGFLQMQQQQAWNSHKRQALNLDSSATSVTSA